VFSIVAANLYVGQLHLEGALMRKRLSPIFWTESVLACITGVIAVLTAVWPDWIEAFTGLQPDQHNGSFEWMLVACCGVVTGLLATLARREWRRAAIETSV
jgi:hypothetical protein